MQKVYFLFILLITLPASAQIIDFPDANFKAKLLSASPANTVASTNPILFGNSYYTTIDINGNGEIEVSEAALITKLDINNSNIANVEGIQYFVNVHKLHCYSNQITYLDVTGFPNLVTLMCSYNLIANPMDLSQCPQLRGASVNHNQIPSLNLTGLTDLIILECEVNLLTELDVTDLVSMTHLGCNFSGITSLDLSNCAALQFVECFQNDIATLTLGNNSNLVSLRCAQNQITELDLSNLPSLLELDCSSNLISELDLSQPTTISGLYCFNNPLVSVDVSTLSILDILYVGSNTLESVYMKNGNNESSLVVYPSPNIEFICADPGQVTDVQDYVASLGYTNCVVDSSCSLGTNNYNQSVDVSVYPNPARDALNINSTFEIRSVSIFNLMGQLVIDLTDITGISKIDVSELKPGNYFIKVNSDKGNAIRRFIKE